MKYFYFIFLIVYSHMMCFSLEPSDTKLKTLYNSLDPTSISQHLAFYELYSSSSWGQKAWQDAWLLLSAHPSKEHPILMDIPLSGKIISSLVNLVNKITKQDLPSLDETAIQFLIKLSSQLHHYHLKGHHVWSEKDVLALPLQEIDLARGLFLSQFGSDRQQIQAYEALIDLMALQIRARLPSQATPEEKIKAINTFIFDEVGFRFPPHSLYAKDIDLYTFLPSVLDSRRGVCLGVSILYLCIAQRLDLALEMVTPPGHIYVRYRDKDKIINIETTARGIHLDCKEYLSLNTHALQQRNIREVIGMAHFNQASVYWQNEEHFKALQAYQKAEPYMKDDPLLKELMGYTLLLTGQKDLGEKLLWQIKDFVPAYAIVKNTIADDYFNGHIDAKGISVIFTRVDEDRQSILTKKKILEETLQCYPKFRAGLVSLAITWLQLHRSKEALEILKAFSTLENQDPEIHYYLSVLYAQRRYFPQAWIHLQQAEKLVNAYHYYPEALKELRRELTSFCPE